MARATIRNTRERARRATARPTADALLAAHNSRTVRDILAPGLDVIFVGINPGLYSGATGHHFARPGNRFWPALHLSGFTPRLLHPSESGDLAGYGVGLTKFVHRATATAAEIAPAEYVRGGRRIRRVIREREPRAVCFLGVGAYRAAYGVKRVSVGLQAEPFESSLSFVLPNPSGLNANYQLPDFIRLFKEVRRALDLPPGSRR